MTKHSGIIALAFVFGCGAKGSEESACQTSSRPLAEQDLSLLGLTTDRLDELSSYSRQGPFKGGVKNGEFRVSATPDRAGARFVARVPANSADTDEPSNCVSTIEVPVRLAFVTDENRSSFQATGHLTVAGRAHAYLTSSSLLVDKSQPPIYPDVPSLEGMLIVDESLRTNLESATIDLVIDAWRDSGKLLLTRASSKPDKTESVVVLGFW